jgi:hypothetical protein
MLLFDRLDRLLNEMQSSHRVAEAIRVLSQPSSPPRFDASLAIEGCKYMGTFDAGDVWLHPEADGSQTLIIKFGDEDYDVRALPLEVARTIDNDLYKQAVAIVDHL